MVEGVNNKPLVHAALSTLSGKFYSTREEVDDAVFEFYGPIQANFPGKSHREFVDMLLASGWIMKKLNGFLITLGANESQPEPLKATPPPAPSVTLSYAEMQVINEIGSAPDGIVPKEQYSLSQPLIDGLIQKRLVEFTSNFPSAERLRNNQAIDTAVTRALQEIKESDYAAAANSLMLAVGYKDKNSKFEMMYALTEQGRAVRERLGSATIQV